LIANAQLENELAGLERELEARRAQVGVVNWERQMAQEMRRGEVVGGEREWKKGVGGLVEVLVAGR
jgi:pre-mRNA-splicing factor SPF27